MVIKLADTKVGQVDHYYDRVGAVTLSLENDLSVGDHIKIVSGENELIQEVYSIEIDHQKVAQAKKGDQIGLKVDQPVKIKSVIYKVS